MRALNVALAVLVSIALAFGTLELGLRAAGLGPPAVNTEFDEALGWRGRPGSRIRRKTAEFDVTLELDGQGLRDDFRSAKDLAKAQGTFRILFLGDSFVNGYAVSRDDLFVDLLEQAYATEGRNIEIVNAGVQGYSTDQQLLWLQTHGKKFRPDLVVAFPYENDIWWNGSATYLEEAKPFFSEQGVLEREILPTPDSKSWLAGTAVGGLPRLFRSLPTVDVEGQQVAVETSSRLASPPPQTLAAEAQTKRLIQRMAEVSREIGAARFVVSPIASKGQMEAPMDVQPTSDPVSADPHRPYRLFEQAAVAAGVTVVETLPNLREAAKAGTTLYYERDFHLNGRGNAVLAHALYGALDAWSLVPALMSPSASAAPSPDREIRTGRWPKWPLWYFALVGVLGTLFSRSYPDEEPQRAYLQVAALLAAVFAAVLLGAGLLSSLPPLASNIALAGLLIGLFSFIAYRLGDRIGTILELLWSFVLHGHWYLLPLLIVLLCAGSLLVVAASSPLAAPLIYTLF